MLKRNSVCIFYGRIHAFISGHSARKCFAFCFSWLNSNTVWFTENGNDLWKSTLSSPSKCNREWVSFFCPWATEMWIEAPVVLLLYQKGRLEGVLPQHWNEEITNSAPHDRVWILSLLSASKSWLHLPAMLTISPLISVCTNHLNSKLLDRSEANVPEGMLVKLAVFRVAKLLKRIYPSQIIAGCKEQSMDSCTKPSISTTKYWTEEIVKHAFGKENTYIFLW